MKIIIYFIVCILCCSGVWAERLGKNEIQSLKKISFSDELFSHTHTLKLQSPYKEKSAKKFNVSRIIKNDSYIIIISSDDKVYLWDIKGTYIGLIGSIGKGPGEYVYPSVVFFHGFNVVIVDGARNLLNVYSLDNKKIRFLDSLDISGIAPAAPSNVLHSKKGYYYFVYQGLPKDFYRVIAVNKKFQVIAKLSKNRENERFACTTSTLVTKNGLVLTDLHKKDKKKSLNVSKRLICISDDNFQITHKNMSHDDIGTLLQDQEEKYLLYDTFNEPSTWHIQAVDGTFYKKVRYRNISSVYEYLRDYELISGHYVGDEGKEKIWIARKKDDNDLYLFFYVVKIPDHL